jgi:hypothetical protein
MANIQEVLQTHLENVKSKVAQAMTDNQRNASGRSVASLTVAVNGNVGTLYGSKSFLAMERGRKGGKVPHGFVGIIKQWIIDKGISVAPIPAKRRNVKYTPHERGLNSFAGAVAYKIMKEGTRLYRDREFNDIFTSAVNEELELMSKELMFYTAESIAHINDTL